MRTTPTAAATEAALKALEEKWGFRYPAIIPPRGAQYVGGVRAYSTGTDTGAERLHHHRRRATYPRRRTTENGNCLLHSWSDNSPDHHLDSLGEVSVGGGWGEAVIAWPSSPRGWRRGTTAGRTWPGEPCRPLVRPVAMAAAVGAASS